MLPYGVFPVLSLIGELHRFIRMLGTKWPLVDRALYKIISVIIIIPVVAQRFYRASYALRGTCHGPVSVSVSDTSQSCTKTAKRRMTQATPHDNPRTVVF